MSNIIWCLVLQHAILYMRLGSLRTFLSVRCCSDSKATARPDGKTRFTIHPHLKRISTVFIIQSFPMASANNKCVSRAKDTTTPPSHPAVAAAFRPERSHPAQHVSASGVGSCMFMFQLTSISFVLFPCVPAS